MDSPMKLIQLRNPLSLMTLMLAGTAAEAVSPSLPVPYTQPANPESLYGDPTRGPEPLDTHVVLPLPPWDEELAQATVNQGNPFSDYGHFRLKEEATMTPWIMTMGSGPTQVSDFQIANMLAQFEPPRAVGDGSLMRYTILRPPADAEMPEGGWPLIVINPGVGSIGQQGLSETLGDTSQWASPYHRAHYPAFVLRWHPQARVTTPVDEHETQAEPAYYAAMEFLDTFIDREPVDRNRIYVMGFSMGGRTTWRNLMDRPDFFAAAVPHSGGGPFPPGSPEASRIAQIPMWMMIGNQDPWAGSARYIGVYQDLVAAGAEHLRFWEQQDVGHQDYSLRSFHIPEWLFAYSLEDAFRAAAPTVLEAPEDRTIIEGEALELKAGLMGAPAPDLQWYKDGTAIEGETGTYHRIDRVRLEDGGIYTVRAVNEHGEVTTEAAELTVVPDTTPPVPLTVAANDVGSLKVSFGEPVAPGSGEGGSENPGHYRLSPEGSVVDAQLEPDGRSVILTVNGLVDGETYSLTVESILDQAATPNPGGTESLDFLYQPSLVGHWPMDDGEGSEARDRSGKDRDALLSDRAEWTTGRIDGGLAFSGNDTRLDVPMDAFDATAGTLAIWARRIDDGSDRRQAIVTKNSNSDPDSRIGIRITQSTGFLSFVLGDQGSISAGQALEENWAFLAITWEDGAYTAYINGEEVASGEYGALSHAGEDLQVGNNTTGSQGFAGAVDDLRLYNRSLAPEEVNTLHLEGITPPSPGMHQTHFLETGEVEIRLQAHAGVQYHIEHTPSISGSTEWSPDPESEVIPESDSEIRFTIDPDSQTGFFRITGRYPEEPEEPGES
jgi:predicted esterase